MAKLNIFIAGHKGMVGSALVRYFNDQNFKIITKKNQSLIY